MDALLKPDAFWLIVVNLLLGLVTISCFVFLAVFIIKDLRLHSKAKKEESYVPDDYLSGLQDLGVAILREGRKIDETEHHM